jgi:hypothetical protein
MTINDERHPVDPFTDFPTLPEPDDGKARRGHIADESGDHCRLCGEAIGVTTFCLGYRWMGETDIPVTHLKPFHARYLPHEEEHLPEAIKQAMIERLMANAFKSGWWQMTPLQLIRRAEQELRELKGAIKHGADPIFVWREAADVTNFCAFAAEVYERRMQL